MLPIIFLIYFTYLPNYLLSKIELFADDVIAYRELNSLQDCVELQKRPE